MEAFKLLKKISSGVLVIAMMMVLVNCGGDDSDPIAVTPPRDNGPIFDGNGNPVVFQNGQGVVFEANLAYTGQGRTVYEQLLKDSEICGKRKGWEGLTYVYQNISCTPLMQANPIIVIQMASTQIDGQAGVPANVAIWGNQGQFLATDKYNDILQGTFFRSSNGFEMRAATEGRVDGGAFTEMLTAPLVTIRAYGNPTDTQVRVDVLYRGMLFATGTAVRR